MAQAVGSNCLLKLLAQRLKLLAQRLKLLAIALMSTQMSIQKHKNHRSIKITTRRAIAPSGITQTVIGPLLLRIPGCRVDLSQSGFKDVGLCFWKPDEPY
ncbi:hypothetical protein P7L53_08665 [Thermoleptolyngbya sichuanensis XZ-Cy5]|uniref:hypothetical protein n=1 Tax=Thermoleptolyngbya sichuanensis TaxID=2885951 RepID=UPI00240E44A1|nr:hypothetical protein [Thermoleptolyngbya sichuanensis]MDG2616316.1 hypothetical protein [Thermoleptolyngbya sichuanensis XZ-Cy5]